MQNPGHIYMNKPDYARGPRAPLTPIPAQIDTRPATDATAPLNLERFLSPEITGPTSHQRWFRFVTRTVDIVVAGGALLAFSPLLLLLALAIRIDSPGPVLFSVEAPPGSTAASHRRT